MAAIKRTEQRLRQIVARQWVQRWGADYVSAIFAEAREAPGISTGTVLRPVKLGERQFHTLSAPETFCALLALHHPDCWDLHEQFVMFPKPREHPLAGHPMAAGESLKPFSGTLDVAERVGRRAQHPRLRLKSESDQNWRSVPFPYVGDLRLFMRDERGAYCVNWSVKNKFADFRRRGPKAKPRPVHAPDDPVAIARLELEQLYHADAGIRTQLASLDRIDVEARYNLRNAFLDHNYPVPLAPALRVEALLRLQTFVGTDIPAYVAARKIATEFQISDRDAVALIHQGVWRRELRVNLFRPLLMNKPLRPEINDILSHFREWFAR